MKRGVIIEIPNHVMVQSTLLYFDPAKVTSRPAPSPPPPPGEDGRRIPRHGDDEGMGGKRHDLD